MFGYISALVLVSYDTDDPVVQNWIIERALKRDGRLNFEERAAKTEAERECVLGPEYWLLKHP